MKIHLIGIGGIGVSALAQYYFSQGNEVSGSDLVASEITDFLQKKDIVIQIGNKPEYITKDLDLVVYSPAVPSTNPELQQAKKLGIQTKSYPEALGELSEKYKTIAVAGAHGKSTTTAMLGLILVEAGFDPTVVVGTKVQEFGGSNFRAGKGEWLVIEACEYDSSFLHYQPNIIVLTNIDKEHLDYFKTFTNVKKTFLDFIEKLPDGGTLVFNQDDKYVPKIKNAKFRQTGYSLQQPETKKVQSVLQVPGMHNVSNALAALETAKVLGISEEKVFSALAKFYGTWRRFEVKEGSAGGKKITVVSDYGHHPNEISATLQAAREKYPDKKITCIFQPHQHQRTYYLFNEFVKTLRKAPVDALVVTDIYDVAGRETEHINRQVSSEELVKKINKKTVRYIRQKDLENFIEQEVQEGQALIIMGAGDIYALVEKFL